MTIEEERALFEADAKPYGFELTRWASVTDEPWTEYVDEFTGHRWAGWLAARDIVTLDCRLCAKWSGKTCLNARACVEGDSFVRSNFTVAAWAKQKSE